jgi:predicted dehydrogenase
MTPKLGFVGCGTHSTTNLYPCLAYADCRLDAVCDRIAGLAERNARLFGAQAAYTDVERMLDERQLDGVLVVGPAEAHHQVGRQVLERGLPLYVEKPTAPDLARAEELVRLARARGTFVMTGYMKRFGTAYRHLQGLIRSGAFQPAMATLRYGHWRSDDLPSMLRYMSVHIIDLAIALLGPVASVASQTARLPSGHRSVALTLRFQGGALAQLVLDSAMPRIQERVEISGLMEGRNALAIVDNVQLLELHRSSEGGVDLLAPELAQIEPRMELADIQLWRPDYGIPNLGQTRQFFQGFVGAVREFTNAIRERRDPSPSPEEALEAMRVIEAVLNCPEGTTELEARVDSAHHAAASAPATAAG